VICYSVRVPNRLRAGIPDLLRTDGERLIILLGGGSKKRQDQDIADAKAAWQEYKHRKKEALKAAAAKHKRK